MCAIRLETGEEPIVCSLTERELAERREAVAPLIRTGFTDSRELDDGFALRFPGDDNTARDILSFILGERARCLFFTFELHFEHSGGPLWLSIRGPDGVKDMVRRMAGLP
jgi:hypothetical protein